MGKQAKEKRTFGTDTELKKLKPEGGWFDVWDEKERGLAVRVGPENSKGSFKRTFIMVARFDGKNPARRRIGEYPSTTLKEARETADEWRRLVGKGKDPRAERERERAELEAQRKAKALKDAQNWEALAERYISEHLGERRDGEAVTYRLRRGKDDAREIRNHLIRPWRDRPISEITPQEVKALIKPIGRKTPALAHLLLNHIKRIFAWALNDDIDYGLTASPAQPLKPEKLIGKKPVRTRVLDDDELAAFWRATGKLRYPMGDLYRLIALTGTRISEASDAVWPEFDFRDRLWTIPSERFKSEQEHVIPLTDRVLVLLGDLPDWTRGQFLFTTTGTAPIGGFSKPKARLDAFMLRTLKAQARKRGDNPAKVKLAPFVIHDIRRTVRTRLSEIGVDDKIAELVIGHGKKGLARVYDHAKHLPEMHDALERWADRLVEIVGEREPDPKVVRLKGRKRKAAA